MGMNRPFNRPFFVVGGAVKKTGGSQSLVKGQLALADNSITLQDGVGIVPSTAGKAKDARDFTLRLGVKEKDVNRSRNNFSESTAPFSLQEVRELRVSAPQITEQTLDELIIGWDGFNDDTAFNFKTGDSYFRFTLELEGGGIEWRGGDEHKELISVNVDIPKCDPFDNCEDCDDCSEVDCRKIITEVVERLRRYELTGGARVDQFVDITPVFSCEEGRDLTPYQYHTLEVCDTGTDTALALVQEQYDAPVIRIGRRDATSTYQVLLPQSEGAPDAYEQTIASIIKGCEDCPAGYDPAVGGFVYAFTFSGTSTEVDSFETALEALDNYVTGSLVNSGVSGNTYFITILNSEKLTAAEKGSLLTSFSGTTISLVGEASDMCENDTVTSVTWDSGEVCNVTEDEYSIVLPDTKCGEDRLEELDTAYPNLTIQIADSDTSAQEVTLTGTSGTANITIDSVDYLATFDTSLANTASDFVTAHGADILTAHGLTVTAEGEVLTFTGLTEGFDSPSIANATGDLAGTVGDLTALPDRKACQTRYVTSVVSNIVCEECDPIFEDFYVTDLPSEYDTIQWKKETPDMAEGSDCLCGIRIKGKPFLLNAEESLRDMINFKEDSVRIRAAADYPEEIREGIGRLPDSTAPVKYLSYFTPRTHLGGNLRDLENEGRSYFRDLHYQDDYLARLLTGTVSNIEDQLKQYVHYTLVVNHEGFQGSFSRQSNQAIAYDIFVEVGRHQDTEDILNDIAANAGVKTVQALG